MTIIVDCPPSSPAPAMRVAGMSVLERILRERARKGATRALVRGDAARLPRLPALPIAVEIVPFDAPLPDGAELIPGDVLLDRRITDEASRRAAEWALMQTCRRPYDGPGDRYIGRAFSLRISRFLSRFPVTPNQVTLLALAVGLGACALAAQGSFRMAGALLALQLILDSVDGELARIRHMYSKLGQWLDNLSDDLIDNLFVAAVGIGLGGRWAVVAVAAAIVRVACSTLTYATVMSQGHGGDVMAFRWWFDREQASTNEIYESMTQAVAARSLGRRDTYVLLWGGLCMAGLPQGALVYGAGIAAIYALLHILNVLLARR